MSLLKEGTPLVTAAAKAGMKRGDGAQVPA